MIYESPLSFNRNAAIINEAYERSRGKKRMKRILEADENGGNTANTAKKGAGKRELLDDGEFLFNDASYDSQRRHKYPGWLRAAAKEHGYELDDSPSGETVRVSKSVDAENRAMKRRTEDMEDTALDGSPSDELYNNIIVAHPEVFNDERYDMNELPKHKKEFHRLWEQYFMKGVGELEAAKRALKEIPGCAPKIEDEMVDFDGYVGNIDDVDDETEETVGDGGRGKFRIAVKRYERNPMGTVGRSSIRYYVPDEFDGVTFDNLEEAKNALRDYMCTLAEERKEKVASHRHGDIEDIDVHIGVILDNDISKKMLQSGEEDDGVWLSGFCKKCKKGETYVPSVYSISSASRLDTDKNVSYATRDYRNGSEMSICDEYMDVDDSE